MVPVKNLGELRWYSGLYYERDLKAGTLSVSQQTFAEDLAQKYNVSWGSRTPMGTSVKLNEFSDGDPVITFPFRELVGSLMWLATQTRPDISNAVRAVARYCASPRQIHWRAALGILGYVKRTSTLGITFRRGSSFGLHPIAFADADYASRGTDRRSVSGGLIMCGGGCVSWFSRTQKCVTLSTSEAEYVAMTDTLKEVLFLRHVWEFMLPEVQRLCIQLFEDNQGAIQLAENPVTGGSSKHIEVRYHFIRQWVQRGEIKIKHVSSELQHADFLTKALPADLFEFHRDYVMSNMNA